MAEEKNKKQDQLVLGEAKYRKKRPQTSKSSKRADHRHKYEKIIVQTPVGWDWSKRCIICGRLSNKFVFASRDFIRPDRRSGTGISSRDFFSLDEMRASFLDVPIYLFDENYDLVPQEQIAPKE